MSCVVIKEDKDVPEDRSEDFEDVRGTIGLMQSHRSY